MWKVLLLAALAVGAASRPSRPLPRPKVAAVILHRRAQSLGAYDPETGRKLGEPTEVGSKPREMVPSSDGKLLYVTNYGVDRFSDVAAGANSIAIVSLTTFKNVGSIDLGRYHRPHGIERGHSGRLYVTTDFPPSVLVIDPAATGGHKVVGAIEMDQSLPHMLAVSADETKLYVANSGSASVSAMRLDLEGRRVGGSNIKVGGVPMGVALSPDERTLYVATRDGNEVVLLETATGRVRARLSLPGQPARVRLTPAGSYLVVSLTEAGDVAIVDTASLRVVHRFPVGAHAEGLTLDAIGGFGYVSVMGENKVVKFSLLDWKPVLEIKTAAAPDPILIVR
jgi:DNA-binding beta-propeller fold protein YncE